MSENNLRLNPKYVGKKILENPVFLLPAIVASSLGGAILTTFPTYHAITEDADTVGSANAQEQADILQNFKTNLHDMERMKLDLDLLKAQDKRAEFDGVDTTEIDAEHDNLLESFEHIAHTTYGMLMAGDNDGAFLSEQQSKTLFAKFNDVQAPAELGYASTINVGVLDECLIDTPNKNTSNSIIATVEHNKDVNACMASEAESDDTIGTIAFGTGIIGGFGLGLFMFFSLFLRLGNQEKYVPAKPKNKHIKHNH